MAYEASQPLKLTLSAAADLSAKQYYFVKLTNTGLVDVCAAVTDRPVGVLQNKPKAGQAAEITVIGVTKVSSDTGITAGAAIGTSIDGQATTKTIGTDTTHFIAGQMLTTTGGGDVIGTALINCAAPARAA
jgi:hypothetical protein